MENYIIANCTDTGRVRSVNEDSMATFDSPNGRIVVVCDGMGGQNAGDVASQLAVAVIQDILTDNTFGTPEEAISRSIMAANQAILHRAAQNPDLSGMGSTCVMLIVKDGKAYYGSVGDSRIYYIAGGNIRQITKDQSYVQTLVDAGQLTQEAAEHHQDKNQITNALGVDGMTPPVIGQLPITPEPGSVFLLCSDGLSGMVSNQTILQTVTRRDLTIHDRAQTLVNQANEAGGLDNITVQLVEFPGGGTAAGVENTGYADPGTAYGAAPMSRPRKKNNTLAYVMISVALVLAGAGVGLYFFLGGDKKEEVSETQTTAPAVQTQKEDEPTRVKRTTTVVEEVQKPAPKAPKAASKAKPGNAVEKAASKNSNKNQLQKQEKPALPATKSKKPEPSQRTMRTIESSEGKKAE